MGGYTSTPQDLYFPATIGKIHYFTPGYMYQEAKPDQVVAMTSFGLECNDKAANTSMGKSARTIPPSILQFYPPQSPSLKKHGVVPKPSPAPADAAFMALQPESI